MVLISVSKTASKNVFTSTTNRSFSLLQAILKSYCSLIYVSTNALVREPNFKVYKRLKIVDLNSLLYRCTQWVQNSDIVDLPKFVSFSLNGMFRKDYLNQPYVKKNIYCKSEMSDRRVKDTQSFLRLEKNTPCLVAALSC